MFSRKRQKFRFFLVPFFVAAAVFSTSCTDFFATSLAPWAARDPNKLIPPVTANNVGDLIAQTKNEPDKSLAVLKKIREAEEKASGEEKTKLQAAALETAANAAGIGQAILGAAGTLTGDLSEDTVKTLVADALNSMKNLEASAALLSGIVPSPGDTGAFNKMTAEAAADDLAMAAIVLIAAEAKGWGNFDSYVDDHLSDDGSLNENEKIAKEMVLALENRTDEFSPNLKKALDNLNLFPQS